MLRTNLVDFDQQYGHRNDVAGYGAALEEFDRWLPQFRGAIDPRRSGDSDLPPIMGATPPFQAPITHANTFRS